MAFTKSASLRSGAPLEYRFKNPSLCGSFYLVLGFGLGTTGSPSEALTPLPLKITEIFSGLLLIKVYTFHTLQVLSQYSTDFVISAFSSITITSLLLVTVFFFGLYTRYPFTFSENSKMMGRSAFLSMSSSSS